MTHHSGSVAVLYMWTPSSYDSEDVDRGSLPARVQEERSIMVTSDRSMTIDEMQRLPRQYWNQQFDRAARATTGMSGPEFIERWDSGEFDELETTNYDRYSALADLAALSGLGRF